MTRKLSEDELDLVEFRLVKHAKRNGRWGSDWSFWSDTRYGQGSHAVAGLGEVRVLKDSLLDAEDDGPLHIIFQIDPIDPKSGETFWVRKNGQYGSYDGTRWDGDFFQVAPVPVNRVEYQQVR